MMTRFAATTFTALVAGVALFVPQMVDGQQSPAPAYSESKSYEPRVFPTPKKKKKEKPSKEADAEAADDQMADGDTKPELIG